MWVFICWFCFLIKKLCKSTNLRHEFAAHAVFLHTVFMNASHHFHHQHQYSHHEQKLLLLYVSTAVLQSVNEKACVPWRAVFVDNVTVRDFINLAFAV